MELPQLEILALFAQEENPQIQLRLPEQFNEETESSIPVKNVMTVILQMEMAELLPVQLKQCMLALEEHGLVQILEPSALLELHLI